MWPKVLILFHSWDVSYDCFLVLNSHAHHGYGKKICKLKEIVCNKRLK